MQLLHAKGLERHGDILSARLKRGLPGKKPVKDFTCRAFHLAFNLALAPWRHKHTRAQTTSNASDEAIKALNASANGAIVKHSSQKELIATVWDGTDYAPSDDQPIEMQPLIKPATSAPKMTAANFFIVFSLHFPAS